MKKTIRKMLALFSIGLFAPLMHAQYLPSTGVETLYDNLMPGTCQFNDVGTDTRSGYVGFGGAGFGSPLYAQFLNVTVNSCRGVAALGRPGFYWQSSSGGSGSSPLPLDAKDPDVVLVSPGPGAAPADIDRVWAIAVYYSAMNGGYCMSIAEFLPTLSFTPMSPAMLIQPYTPTYEAHINIDADHYGHFGVVMQLATGIVSRTQTVLSVPTVPGNAMFHDNLIEPDIAFLNNTAMQSNIIALTPDRQFYRTFTRNYLAGFTFSNYTSAPFSEMREPRIAAPNVGTFDDYAITVGWKHAVGPNILHDILFQQNEGVVRIVNDGTGTGFPAANNINNPNVLPCLTYAYENYGGTLIERVSLGWYTEGLTASIFSPNQPFTFVGIDLAGGSPIIPGVYLDISNANGDNNESAMAISGRFSDWVKSVAFTYDAGTPGFGNNLRWKYVPTGGTTWKSAAPQDALAEVLSEEIKLYPNPANDKISFDISNWEDGYSYQVYNQLGQSMLNSSISTSKVSIDLQGLPSGLYFVKIKNQTRNEVSNLKFIKE